ncbi:hypothetical protein SAMN05443144_11212 [Fodinibius roseus]|uniref:Uncharacterized protein n=1 Tax=Fodinibius roseus TaxID=1194090 RepID=A0A1M5DRR0_9BACT|nr:hypothetical protein SAMN05443144_11212 [Fodinibius roseus]
MINVINISYINRLYTVKEAKFQALVTYCN